MSDTIYREDAIKAMEQTYQDILRIFKRKVKDGEKAIALDMIGCVKSLPSADRPSESIGKLIERMEEYRDKQLLMSDYWYGINWAINTIRVSDIVDRPQGEWIKTDRTYCGSTIYKCSVCGADIDEMPTVMGVPKYKSCPYCRTEMKGEDDE